MNHNQIQEIGKQEINQPLSDDNEMRVKKRNEVSAIASLVFGVIAALLFDPFIGYIASSLIVLILYFLGYILGFTEIQLFGKESIFDDSYGTMLSIVGYGMMAFYCMASLFFSVVGIVLAWQGRKTSNWCFAIWGLAINLIALLLVILFLYCFFTGKMIF